MTLKCGRKKPVRPPRANWRQLLESYLKTEGHRTTGPREKVAEVALQQPSHFEIQTLVREVQQRYPDISPATVYRSVKTLCEAGLLNETLQSETGVPLYEAHDEDHHDHVVCMDCGEIFEFHDEGLENAQSKALHKINFEPVRHKHVIYARCTRLNK